MDGGSAVHHYCNSLVVVDCENAYQSAKVHCDESEFIHQNTHIVGGRDRLFYTPVKIGERVRLNAMLDSGSMACTISESAEMALRSAGAVNECDNFVVDVTLVGCGGLRVKPRSSFNLAIEVYGIKMIVPTLVDPGQHDEIILGTNVIKHILRYFKMSEKRSLKR